MLVRELLVLIFHLSVPIVLEISNMAQLASNRSLIVHAQPQEGRCDTDDTSAAQIYEIFVSKSRVLAMS